MRERRKISLVLVDVDGTLVTEQKVLTKRARAAVRYLRAAGIRFAVTSGRPPRGMAMLLDDLKLDTPIAAFNGRLFVTPHLAIDAQAAFGQRATANRSQPYYLDIIHKDANKGAVVEFLSRCLELPAAEIATIGDQPNDVLMFKRSGFSIAMGNASDQVKQQADITTDSSDDEGFAKAMERFILRSSQTMS